ncbi:MFS transporter [Haloarchaeobius amylolyticus]|uniref:MFS transporter n=1 Tax=Haloarchaeobius amylolyticus TaxID=1198296 RepID=UPI002270B618|nr:MFS transporter [Haloarchaeobius amylolyticus]
MTLLRNHSFARLFAGRLVTNMGDSLYFVAAMWLVYDLTGNEFYSGLAGFLTLAPSAFQAFAGPLVDRWDLRRLLVGTQLVQAVLILAVPVAHALGLLTVWVVLVVMPLLSLLNQLVYPAESAALPRVVEKDELVQANSLFAMAYQGVDAVFNALGGLLVAAFGAVAIFVFDSVTFLAAALLFASVRLPAADGPAEASTAAADSDAVADGLVTDGGAGAERGYLAELREGFAFVRGTILLTMLGGSLVINFTFGATIAAMPAYGDLLGGAGAYGLLMAGLGVGMLVGSLLAGRFGDRAFGRLTIASMAAAGVLWTVAIWLAWTPATVALVAVALVPTGITNVLIVSMVQSLVPEHLLGRVMAVTGSASAVATPFGALAGGALAAAFGPAMVMSMAGGGFLFLAAYVAAVPSLRRMPAVGDVETLAA